MIKENEAEREYNNNNNISDGIQLIHKMKNILSNNNNNNGLEIKKIFREIRGFFSIKNKSNYLLQSKEIKLIKDNLNIYLIDKIIIISIYSHL